MSRYDPPRVQYVQHGGLGCGTAVWLVGMMIAVNISWSMGHSLLWTTIRGLLGWVWIAYRYLLS